MSLRRNSIMGTVQSIHEKLRSELSTYIKTQYIGKNNLLLNALSEKLDEQGVLWQQPFVELPASYKQAEGGIKGVELPKWLINFLFALSQKRLGVFKAPFSHQVEALEKAYEGRDLFVSTGTGSGKTECFMWPLITKIVGEAKNTPQAWNGSRGVRAIVMYPMNALVADQISRLRRIIGKEDFESIFKKFAGVESRRPQFGMYTGRTPYAGKEPKDTHDKDLADSLRRFLLASDDGIFEQLDNEGKIPAKHNLDGFIQCLRRNEHMTSPKDAELVTRFEMQKTCPDILITNYSMLELMLLRRQEESIWNSTKRWLNESKENKLLFIMDEAHMYRGASGGEVALLLRRLFHKLGIVRERVQFILTTASMPKDTTDDELSIKVFAQHLTAAESDSFHYVYGSIVEESKRSTKTLSLDCLLKWDNDAPLQSINEIFGKYTNPFPEISIAQEWLYENLKEFDVFGMINEKCRGSATSALEIAESLNVEFLRIQL